MLRRTTRTVHTATAQWTRTLCPATTRRTCLPLLHRTTFTTSIPATTSLTTGSPRLVAARGQLVSHTTRRYLQQNAFEALGIYKPLAENLAYTKQITHPTKLQKSFIPPILLNKDVLIRDTTGSGKTFGVLLAVLNKPRRKMVVGNGVSVGGGNGITSVVVVPNQELAFQLVEWTKELFPSLWEEEGEGFLDGMIQAVVTPPSSPLDPTSTGKPARAAGPGGYTSTGKKGRHRPRATSSSNTKADEEQIEKLAQNPPHVLVATPHRLWDLLQRGVLDLSQIETLVLDEVDHLIRLPNRFASRKQVLNRDLHPKPAELAVSEILRSAQAAGRYPPSLAPAEATDQETGLSMEDQDTTTSSGGKVARTGKGADRIQIVAASATMNRPMRHWLETVRGWVQDPTWVDTTKSVVLPEGIEHRCIIVGPDSVRNMRFDTSESEKVSGSGGREELEVDMAETDRAWNQSKDASYTPTSKEKEAAWKERSLTARGVISPDIDTGAVEKFRDDDDRMLEGVAMACQLDDVKSACVFFCTSFSLKDLATRFEFEFGLPVKTIQDAFPLSLPPSSTSTSTSTLTTTATTKKRSAGIYIAHEENARGLDLPGLSHVFIVGLPSSPSSYLHMAGRTGRMGERGEVVTILRDDEFLEDRARSLFRMLSVKVEPYQHVE
ncbi:hypothetical protein EC957_000820 [Mortierella hygrophila]|uniref:RNA helicase n=1 Tax=Mortierella hygrophila TaxID=979708 RepID=A0A9P6K2P0_9FUNG|nr:hypothetical protein EC957_000820 [Mortierella hygrophila]